MNRLKSRVKIPMFLVLLGGMVVMATAVNAQNTQIAEDAPLSGIVVDSTTQMPISGIEIEIEGTEMSSETNEEGSYIFSDLNPGTYTVVIQADGYQEVTREVDITNEPKEENFSLQSGESNGTSTDSPTGSSTD